MKYMIHACPERMWYVEKYLIPSMTAQGIAKRDIKVWNDEEGRGNLFSFMESMKECGKKPGGMWHLQDDVLICSDFAERTKKAKGVTCGFCTDKFDKFGEYVGEVESVKMWYSFQCIYIPNDIAKDCADWFWNDVLRRGRFQPDVREGKGDDGFFHRFILERHLDEHVTNVAPNLVEHVDYLIGGSIINSARLSARCTAKYWEEPELTERLEAGLTVDRFSDNGET